MNNKYHKEAEVLYGNTAQYQEYIKRNKSSEELNDSGHKLMEILKEFSSLINESDDIICQQVEVLKNFITNNFYTCDDNILLGLSDLYINDERFKNNIDKVGGEGTAVFVSKSIKKYLSNK